MSILRRPFRYSFVNTTLALIAINVAVFFLMAVTPLSRYYAYLALTVRGFVYYHCFWQPVTYMFVHSGMNHLFFNMLALLFFGLSVEKAIGSKEFLLLYLLTGTLCGVLSLALYVLCGVPVALVGASGAIYGILLAYAVIFPRSRIYVWWIIPVPAPILVLLYAVIELANQFYGASGVAHLTHLAGFAVAWLYFRIRMGIRPLQVWKDAYR